MRDKLIFLDIDGVMNNSRTFEAMTELEKVNPLNPRTDSVRWHQRMIDGRSVHLLKRVIEHTNAKIVISSTWRLGNDMLFFDKLFKPWNFPRKVFIGKTIADGGEITKRGEQILEWLHRDEREWDWVCIDDDIFDIKDIVPDDNIVGTNFIDGFDKRAMKRTIRLLTK